MLTLNEAVACRRVNRLSLRVVVAAGLCGLGVGPCGATAQAHDAPMPNDARHGLLIDEPWVTHHWAPFDERTAERALSLRRGQLIAFLYNDHHTIAQLARRRGIGFERLVDELSAWSDHTPGADPKVIRQRTRLMLVSGHLAQHVFGHLFHNMAFTSVLVRASGLSEPAFSARRGSGETYRALVRLGHGDPAAVQYKISLGVARNAQRGFAQHETPESEAQRMERVQHARLHCWFTRPEQYLDPAAPYDRRYTKHAKSHTAADVPTTVAEQAVEDAAIQRGLEGRPPSCWDKPALLAINPGAPLTRRELRKLARVPNGFKGKTNARGGDMHHTM